MSQPTQLRALASIVEDLEQRGVDVTIEDVGDWNHTDALQADLALELSEAINPREAVAVEGDDPDDGPDEDGQSENRESEADGAQDRADAGDEDGEVDQADGDDRQDDEPLACPEAGCGYTTESERGLNIHQTKAHSSHDDGWCGVCGDGPFAGIEGVSGHHSGTGHEGDLQPVGDPPGDNATGGGHGDQQIGVGVLRRRRAGLARRAIIPRGCRAERGPRRADHDGRVGRSRATGGARQGDRRRRRACHGGV